jgi:hypothetical protein
MERMGEDPRSVPAAKAKLGEYEPPQVLNVMDADELGREVLYAGREPPISG